MEAPKLFISYSWSDIDHEKWVLDLATELRQSGIDVQLDKWDLKEGDSTIFFMEKMVNDDDIRKVAIISDKIYCEKSNSKKGGVGTESQIISPEIYEHQQQDKFVVIVAERDENGKAYIPTFYKGRKYIDLSDIDSYSDEFEKLVKWICNKPIYEKPPLGKLPSYIEETNFISLGTTALFKRAIDALKKSKPNTSGAIEDYLEIFSMNLEKFRINVSFTGHTLNDDEIIASIDNFQPYKNEFLELIRTIARYELSENNIERIHKFFEKIIMYMFRPQHINKWNELDFDNFKFIVHELFLCTIAIIIKQRNFSAVNYLLKNHYYINADNINGMKNFTLFDKTIRSLFDRNTRLNLNLISLRATILKERNKEIFDDLMEADFILFMRSEIDSSNQYQRWCPYTLLYLGDFPKRFEIFVRAESKDFFDSFKQILNITDVKDLDPLLLSYQKDLRQLPSFGSFSTFSPFDLLNYGKLASRP